MKVFLGGTCNKSKWRDEIIKDFEQNGIDYFNPIVKDWNEKAQREEIKQRQKCDFCLYTITPKMSGVYSIAEVIDDANKRPKKTIFCLLNNDEDEKFSDPQLKSLEQVGKMVEENGGKFVKSLKKVTETVKKLSEK